jgi:hypothetical protein
MLKYIQLNNIFQINAAFNHSANDGSRFIVLASNIMDILGKVVINNIV